MVEILGGPREFPMKPIPDPAEKRDFISQQQNAQQDRQETLTGSDEHHHSDRNAEPSGGVLEHDFDVPVPDWLFHQLNLKPMRVFSDRDSRFSPFAGKNPKVPSFGPLK